MKNNPQLFLMPEFCPYCASKCELIDTKVTRYQVNSFDIEHVSSMLYICQVCGWWTIPCLKIHYESDNETEFYFAGQARGELVSFDTSVAEQPMIELKRYLAAHYEARYVIDPFKVEAIVASIFRDAGYMVEETSRSGDNGIDLFVVQKNDSTRAAIQVKRYKGSVGAELIRSFAGALLYEGVTRGVFVTTHKFTRGARITAHNYDQDRGYYIDLIDGERLLSMLKVGVKPAFEKSGELHGVVSELWSAPEAIAQSMLNSFTYIEI